MVLGGVLLVLAIVGAVAVAVVAGAALRGRRRASPFTAHDAAWKVVVAAAPELGLELSSDPFVLVGQHAGCKVSVEGRRQVGVGFLEGTWMSASHAEPLPFAFVVSSRSVLPSERYLWQPAWLARVETEQEAAARRLITRIAPALRPLALAFGPSPEAAPDAPWRELSITQWGVTIQLGKDASVADVRDGLRSVVTLSNLIHTTLPELAAVMS